MMNQGGSPLPVALSLFDAKGKASVQNLILPPRGMNRVSVRQLIAKAGLVGSFGGIKVAALTHAGSLDTLHVLFDQAAEFSAIMKMFFYDPRSQIKERDYAKTGKWTLRAPMLALSKPDPSLAFPPGTVLHPQLFIRNTTPKQIDASLTFNWRSNLDSGVSPSAALRLAPHETRRIDVGALQDGRTLPQSAQWASVALVTSALPDEVMAVASSYDDSLRYGTQTPFSDQLSAVWAGGQWQYDPQHDSIITAGNGGSQPTLAAFTIFYNQGTQKYQLEQTLQPGEQMWMDIGKLIRESFPDKNGKSLPVDLTSGSYEVRDLTNKVFGTLFEGKIIYDRTYGHVTYGCAACCGYNIPPVLWYNPIGIPFEGTEADGVLGWFPCDDSYEDVSSSFYGAWSSVNTSVATVDHYGTHTGVALGSTTTGASGCIPDNNEHVFCPLQSCNPTGGANVFATPTNFRQTSTSDNGNGDIHFNYAWDSSSGNLSDLSSCSVLETVTYPGSGNYSWSIPFPAISSTNPTILRIPGTDGTGQDDNGLFNPDGTVNTNFRTPYTASSFTAEQTFSYSCNHSGVISSGSLLGPLAIVRQVSQNTDGTWKFTATKPTSGSATINPLP